MEIQFHQAQHLIRHAQNETDAAKLARERLDAIRREAESFVANSETLLREQDQALRASGELEARLASERLEACLLYTSDAADE